MSSARVNSALDAGEAQQILDKHNCARRRYGLRPLVWDWELAAHAQEHADRCIWDHASNIGLGVPGEGENLSLAMNRPVGVDGWLAEEQIYDCLDGSCRPTSAIKMCGHWTQVCWHNSARIGCGRRRCDSLQKAPGFINSDLLVCRYSPPGNYIGQRMSTAEQCAQGAANANCAGGSAATVTAPAPAPKDTATVTAAAAAAAAAAASPRSTTMGGETTSQGNTSAPMTDQFESEQKRVAALRAAAGLPVYERAATSQQRAPLYTAQPVTEEERDTLHSAAPQTVVQPDASTDGHAPAEETIASRASFSTALIVIIALIAVCVVLLIAYFFYQYRAQFGQWSARMFEKMKFTT